MADGHVPDAVYEHVRKEFDEAVVAAFTAAAVAINAWYREAASRRGSTRGR